MSETVTVETEGYTYLRDGESWFLSMRGEGFPYLFERSDDTMVEWEEVVYLLNALAASQAETLGLREERDTLRERVSASATGMATLNDRIAELEGAYTAACGYIDVSVCDPDITAEMWQAWQKFKETRAALGRMLKGVADAPLSSSPQAQNTEGENGTL